MDKGDIALEGMYFWEIDMSKFDVRLLRRRLVDDQSEIRRDALRSLMELGPEASMLLPTVWEIALLDPSMAVRDTAYQALWAIEVDSQALHDRLMSMLTGSDRNQIRAALSMLGQLELDDEEREVILNQLWMLLRTGDVTGMEVACLSAMAALSSELELVVRLLLADPKICEQRKYNLLMSGEYDEEIAQQILRDPEHMVPLAVDVLVAEGLNDRSEMITWIAGMSSSLPTRWRHVVGDAMWLLMYKYGQGFAAYCLLEGQEEALSRLVSDPTIPQEIIGALLLTDAPPGLLQGYLASNEYLCMSYILEALVHPDWTIRAIAAEWVGQNGASLSQDLYEQSIDSLEKRVREDINSDLQAISVKALAMLVQERRRDRLMRQGELVRLIQNETLDEGSRARALESLARSDSQEAMAAIIREWLHWLSTGRGMLLIDLAENLLRRSKYAVLPLTNRLLQASVLREAGSENLVESSSRELVVRRRTVRMLSEMSDERFFEGEGWLHSSIITELRNHAIPILAGRLPEEDDVVVRESIACLLSRVGGSEAVAAITRAIGSEERTRMFRQDLLATYYLDPSKKRGEQAAQILEGAVSEAERTMRVLQGLNILLFAAGLLVIGVGITAALIGDELISRVLGMTAALGSLGGLIVQLIHHPLERIQSSVARLVQLETAFTSFIWELNLNSTYIQSLYVADGKLSDDSIAKTVGRLEQAMELTMKLVCQYGGDQESGPYETESPSGLERTDR
jgi:hypothetical protein